MCEREAYPCKGCGGYTHSGYMRLRKELIDTGKENAKLLRSTIDPEIRSYALGCAVGISDNLETLRQCDCETA